MATYFGNETQVGDDSPSYWFTYWHGVGYLCPGSGNQTVKELSGYCYGVGSNCRLAVYSADGTILKCQGNAEKAIVGASYTWQGHMSTSEITGTLVGGVTYLLLFTADGTAAHIGVGSYSAGSDSYVYTDYTGGFPTPAPTPGGTQDYPPCIRCGVDPEAGGGLDYSMKQVLVCG